VSFAHGPRTVAVGTSRFARSARAPANGSAPGKTPRKPKKATTRILIVEDDYLGAAALEGGLAEAGMRVVGVAGSAEEAVQLVKAERPTVVIMDIRLNGRRDGVDAALEIFRSAGVRCIFATAHHDPPTRARAESASPLGWLAKPYTVDSVVAMIKAAERELNRRN
jgi:DNA-binding NarL/FixJ family response regulator